MGKNTKAIIVIATIVGIGIAAYYIKKGLDAKAEFEKDNEM